MKGTLWGVGIGIIIFLFYLTLGLTLSNTSAEISDFIPFLLLILAFGLNLGLFIDSIRLKWSYWLRGGLLFGMFSTSYVIPFIGGITALVTAIPASISGLIVGCKGGDILPVCHGFFQITLSIILTFIILFIIGSILGIFFEKIMNKKQLYLNL